MTCNEEWPQWPEVNKTYKNQQPIQTREVTGKCSLLQNLKRIKNVNLIQACVNEQKFKKYFQLVVFNPYFVLLNSILKV